METHAIQNFQIPVENFERALHFYSTLMDYPLEVMEFQGVKLGVFRSDPKTGVGGTIIFGGEQKPSKKGTIIFLQCGENLSSNLSRMEKTGGSIHIGKTELGPGWGFYAIIHDTEGNRVGLYSKK